MEPKNGAALAQLRKGVVEYCVLATLKASPSYGLAIADKLRRFDLLMSSEGTLYPLLSRMRKRGWVNSTWQESSSGPMRRYYELTPEGEAALAGFTAVWTDFSKQVDDVIRETGGA
ncbi:MAG: PadR family transcriptional regulator [Flaviflexus sp.]|uniref:PadR family transcriptional regulator n=1 Tax=Flaviflexus sp. TaxID=1969482 RepID=UPI003F8F0B14